MGLVNSTDSKLKSNEMMERMLKELDKVLVLVSHHTEASAKSALHLRVQACGRRKQRKEQARSYNLFENVLIENDKWDTFGCICKVFKGSAFFCQRH